jgi:Sensors of blue-light using FAD.
MSEPLVSVSYVSTATAPFDDERLADLLAQSRRSNHAHDLTGMLLYRRVGSSRCSRDRRTRWST